nr:syntaxin-8 isoform X2 [Taeniopygia guttata]
MEQSPVSPNLNRNKYDCGGAASAGEEISSCTLMSGSQQQHGIERSPSCAVEGAAPVHPQEQLWSAGCVPGLPKCRNLDHRRPHEPGGEHGRAAAQPDPAREDGGEEIGVLRDAGGDRAAAHRHRRGRALAHGITPTPLELLCLGSSRAREGPAEGRERTPSIAGNDSTAGNELHPSLGMTPQLETNCIHRWD